MEWSRPDPQGADVRSHPEGKDGEEVKEYYSYLDATPANSYFNDRYKYPLVESPCNDLVATNRSRTRTEMEYELIDTGVCDDPGRSRMPSLPLMGDGDYARA